MTSYRTARIMRQSDLFKLLGVVLLFVTGCKAGKGWNGSFELTWNQEVEERYKKLNPDLDNLESKPWALAENLTAETLKEVCNNVMIDRTPPWEASMQWTQAYIPPEEGKLGERVMKHAEALFQEGRKNMTVIRCVYKWFDFWLTRGNDEVVYKLDRDLVDNVWLFDCGPFRLRR